MAFLVELPQSFIARTVELVAPKLIGCLLVKLQALDVLLWGVILETEAYSQDVTAHQENIQSSYLNVTMLGEHAAFTPMLASASN